MERHKYMNQHHAMRTILATRNKDGHLELLEPVDLPVGKQVPILIPLIPPEAGKSQRGTLPIRTLGPVKGRLTRDEIYGNLL